MRLQITSLQNNVNNFNNEPQSPSKHTESSMFRGKCVSINESEIVSGLPVVRLRPLSKQYTIHHTTLRLSLYKVSAIAPPGGSR